LGFSHDIRRTGAKRRRRDHVHSTEKQLKREDITLEKNKHFYRGVFEVAFGEHQEETKEKIRELAKEDVDQ